MWFLAHFEYCSALVIVTTTFRRSFIQPLTKSNNFKKSASNCIRLGSPSPEKKRVKQKMLYNLLQILCTTCVILFPIFISNYSHSCSDTKPSILYNNFITLYKLSATRRRGCISGIYRGWPAVEGKKSRSSRQLYNFRYFSCMENTKIKPHSLNLLGSSAVSDVNVAKLGVGFSKALHTPGIMRSFKSTFCFRLDSLLD